MILIRQEFQVKFGHMDEVLAAFKSIAESENISASISRVLTDISGKNFTLVFESKVVSLDAYWEGLQASFDDPEMGPQISQVMPYIESGRKDFYTIEYEAEN